MSQVKEGKDPGIVDPRDENSMSTYMLLSVSCRYSSTVGGKKRLLSRGPYRLNATGDKDVKLIARASRNFVVAGIFS